MSHGETNAIEPNVYSTLKKLQYTEQTVNILPTKDDAGNKWAANNIKVYERERKDKKRRKGEREERKDGA